MASTFTNSYDFIIYIYIFIFSSCILLYSVSACVVSFFLSFLSYDSMQQKFLEYCLLLKWRIWKCKAIENMGACVSSQQGCFGGMFNSSKKKRRRTTIGFRKNGSSSLDNNNNNHNIVDLPQHSFSNPTFQGSCNIHVYFFLHFTEIIFGWSLSFEFCWNWNLYVFKCMFELTLSLTESRWIQT